MADRTPEHEKLIEEAKELGIAAAHLFALDNLKEKIEEAKREAKRVKGDEGNAPENSKDGEQPLKEEMSPIAASIKRMGTAVKDKVLGTSEEDKDDSDGDTPDGDESESPGDPTVKKGRGWLYHETEQPRVFADGEDVPEGWNLENHKCWKYSDTGKCVNVKG